MLITNPLGIVISLALLLSCPSFVLHPRPLGVIISLANHKSPWDCHKPCVASQLPQHSCPSTAALAQLPQHSCPSTSALAQLLQPSCPSSAAPAQLPQLSCLSQAAPAQLPFEIWLGTVTPLICYKIVDLHKELHNKLPCIFRAQISLKFLALFWALVGCCFSHNFSPDSRGEFAPEG